MDDAAREGKEPVGSTQVDVPALVRQAIDEFVRADQNKKEPAYKAELQEERRRREELERRLNDMVEENKRSRQMAEQAERSSAIRAELQRLGVGKVELAYKAVKDDIARTEDGRLIGKTDGGDVGMKEYLANFVTSNPEFLPARISGGSGVTPSQKTSSSSSGGIDLEKIRPGMSAEDLERAREEIARIASQSFRGA